MVEHSPQILESDEKATVCDHYFNFPIKTADSLELKKERKRVVVGGWGGVGGWAGVGVGGTCGLL